MVRRVLSVVYLVIGLLVAGQHGYLGQLTGAARVLSAVLTVALWPLVLLGIHLNVT